MRPTKIAGKESIRLGDGVFTVYDVAQILRIPYHKANYWFNSYVKDKLQKSSKFQYYFKVGNVVGVNFFMLIELHAFHKMRERRIPLRKIIEIHAYLKKSLRTPYPFAASHLGLAGKEILMSADPTYEFLTTADESLQIVISQIVKPFFQKIEFSAIDGLAVKFYPLGRNRSVVVSRRNQFGQPTIDGTNIKVSTLYNYYRGGEEMESIARMYDLHPNQVSDAIEFSNAA
jgi:uncharacterized protein (DUF433 family)